MPNKYFFGKGRVFFAEKDETTGLAKQLIWAGNVKKLNFGFETELLTHKEDYTGQGLEDVRKVIGKSASMTAEMENFDLDMLALGLYSSKVSVDGSTVEGEPLPAGLAVGDEVATQHPKISLLVVKDSAGTPGTLTLNTHYSIEDATTGRIKILNLGSFTQPFELDYTYGARKDLGIFMSTPPNRWLRYEGINLLTNKKALFELYNLSLDVMSELALISDGNTVSGYTMKGAALMEPLIPADDELGQFGRIRDLA
jgi:hypothetical protein